MKRDRFDPCCRDCMRPPEEIPGRVTPDKLEEFGWVNVGVGDWLCQMCDAEAGNEDDPGELKEWHDYDPDC